MKRRNFIKKSVGGLVVPTMLNGMSAKAFGLNSGSLLDAFTTQTDHVLVIIQLQGGNDGLNTLIPLDKYSLLANNRNNVLIPQNKLLSIAGQPNNALHPALKGFQQLFDAGKMSAIQSVAYPSQNLSHFRSTDIWMTGSDAKTVVNNGWIGRYLNYEYPNFPVGYPNNQMPDPLGLEIAYSPTLTFMGPQQGMGITVADPSTFYSFVQGTSGTVPNTPAGEQLKFVREIASESLYYNKKVTDAFVKVKQQKPYPATKLGEKLKIIAGLIAGGLKTRIYMVTLGGFDTHAGQVETFDKTTGVHAELLKELGDGVKAFMDDCAFLGINDRVMGMTFSEFGRRILSNGSNGTDHGIAAPMFMFGDKIAPGILGNNPTIPTAATLDDNVAMQFDYRSVYTSILKDWFCVPKGDLQKIMLEDFSTLPIIKAGSCITSIHDLNEAAGKSLISNYPNPFTETTTFTFESDGGNCIVKIFDVQGHLVSTPIQGVYAEGKHTFYWNSEDLPTGTYYAYYRNGQLNQTKSILKVK